MSQLALQTRSAQGSTSDSGPGAADAGSTAASATLTGTGHAAPAAATAAAAGPSGHTGGEGGGGHGHTHTHTPAAAAGVTTRLPPHQNTLFTGSRPSAGPPRSPMSTPGGSAAASRGHPGKGAPRNSSMDSAISAISTKSQSQRGASGSQSSDPTDIAALIKTAGSPEAVIQYLLKEKQSQSQQNAQLWRLVDKQRAMILGLNKDLERALKDKEKYRKKLKEVINVPETIASDGSRTSSKVMKMPVHKAIPTVDISAPKERQVVAPDSPTLDSDSQKHSPVDLAMAPYPITPPADQPNGPPSAVGELLDPSHEMPRAHEHAYDQFNHDAEEQAADAARKALEAEQYMDLPRSSPETTQSTPDRLGYR
ncbi:RhoGAP domain-containing protein [Colletotrichum gloeosporioides Cg-14]|uniref:RhoGAP domain-containing protein n=1 Tax=Colletotrichum gloeosporioides (strain Cg-14) TaxID=1237896 RepID=T0JUJ5_COLGC|nr:RhoGAP domain-containing protein [Colletotrichum gloeosporioides Cg-14]